MSSRRNTSVLWNYFVKDVASAKARCTTCGELYSYKTTTGNLKIHLRKKHTHFYKQVCLAQGIDPKFPTKSIKRESSFRSDKKNNEILNQPDSSELHSLISLHHESCIKDESGFSQPSVSFVTQKSEVPIETEQNRSKNCRTQKISVAQKNKIDRDLLDLFIDSYQSFSLVEERAFQKFCRWIPGYELPSRKTISENMIPALYEKTKAIVTRELTENDFLKICLTVDLWTFRENESYISLTGHYITNNFELKSILISCSNFEGTHTSENVLGTVLDITNEWSLTEKVNFVVTDIAENIEIDVQGIQWQHYECFGHTLNTIVQNSLGIVEDNLNKLKRIVLHFRTSSGAMKKLLEAQTIENPTAIPIGLVEEVPTKWHSSFYMVQRFVELEQYLRAVLEDLSSEVPTISNEEWQLFSDLIKILKPFDDVTNEKYITGSSVIVMTRCLIAACTNLSHESFSELSLQVVDGLKNGLESKFANVEKCDDYTICTFLDPRYKLTVFNDPIDARNTRTRVQEQLVSFIENESNLNETVSLAPASLGKFSPWSILNDIVGANQPGTALSKATKEITAYLNDDNLPIFSQNGSFNCPLEWWRNHHFAYPNLAQLFRKYGSIMATSVPCEMIFSDASDRRTLFDFEKVSQLTFLNGNLDLIMTSDNDS